jgi:hypothetical protein
VIRRKFVCCGLGGGWVLLDIDEDEEKGNDTAVEKADLRPLNHGANPLRLPPETRLLQPRIRILRTPSP